MFYVIVNIKQVKKLNDFLQKTLKKYQELRAKMKSTQNAAINSKSEMDEDDDDEDIDMKEDVNKNKELQEEYKKIIATMEQLITIYVTFVSLVPNIAIDQNAISGLLSIIEDDGPYQLLAPLMMFIVLCPRFLRMANFERVCTVCYNHPLLDIDFFMMLHYILQETYQPILDSLKSYTKLPVNSIKATVFHHFKELKQAFLQSKIIGNSQDNNYIFKFFVSTKELLNYKSVETYLNKMKALHCGQVFDSSKLYLLKLRRFLDTAQSIVCKQNSFSTF